jgi:hypothetical protein
VNEEDLFESMDVFALSVLVLAPEHEMGTTTVRGAASDGHLIDRAINFRRRKPDCAGGCTGSKRRTS